MKLLFIAFILSAPAFAQFEHDLSGNIEAQGRHSQNNEASREELFQDWNRDDFYLMYGNLNGKASYNNMRLESNWFARHSKSSLYEGGFLATQAYTFPNRLVVRDMFRMQHIKQEDDYKTESILNKLLLGVDFEESRFVFGRMYINYGLGEIFNPINPFNQPTGLTAISQVAQGNDGGSVTYFASDKHTVDLYVLGDKSINNYDGSIDRTIWVHGEVQATEDLNIDYVFGDDQKRYKGGGQVSYQFEEAMLFSQIFYQSHTTHDEISQNFWDALLGYDEQLTNKWHLRLETGYQKKNRFQNPLVFGDRFLPTEYFVALANQYEIHPLIEINGTIINDVKTGFTYFITKGIFSLGSNVEAEVFAFLPVAKGSDPENISQKLVTTDVGMALRAFF